MYFVKKINWIQNGNVYSRPIPSGELRITRKVRKDGAEYFHFAHLGELTSYVQESMQYDRFAPPEMEYFYSQFPTFEEADKFALKYLNEDILQETIFCNETMEGIVL